MVKHRNFLLMGSIAGGLAVVLGAFGAHSLRDVLDARQLSTFETGVRYQMYHGMAILFVFLLLQVTEHRLLYYAARAFLAGIVLFSGSLYLLACQDLMGVDWKWLGPVTPLGGACFITGWILCAAASFMKHSGIKR